MIPTDKKEGLTASSVVLDVLAEKPRLTIKDLYEYFLAQGGKKMTLQGFYNLVGNLIHQHVLVKEGKIVSIDASWIYNLVQFTERAKKLCFGKEAYAFNILLREGEQKSFTFETVKEMDNFWHHALFLVVQFYETEKHSDKNGYVYTEHGWFQLVRTDMELSLARLYAQHNMQLYQLIGSKIFLDLLVSNVMDEENYHIRQQVIAEFGKNYYGMVIGDFIFGTAMPKYIYELMEEVYQRTNTLAEFHPEDIMRLIEMPARTTIVIRRNKKQALVFRKKIKEAFEC